MGWLQGPLHTQRWAGYFLLVGGIGMVAAGVWFVAEAMTFLDRTLRTDGTVVALERKRNVKGFDQDHPVVRFIQPESLETVEFISRFDMWPSPFAVLDKVEVAYDPADPGSARINSFWTSWFLSLLLVAFGLACVSAGYCTLRRHRRDGAPPPGARS